MAATAWMVAPMRAALLNPFFAAQAAEDDNLNSQAHGVARDSSSQSNTSWILPRENMCQGCSGERGIPGSFHQRPLDRSLCSNDESARRASLSVDIESSHNVAVDCACVGEGHVRGGDNARRDRIARARLVSDIRKTDVWSRNENHDEEEKHDRKNDHQCRP